VVVADVKKKLTGNWNEVSINNRKNRKFKKKKSHLLPSSVTIFIQAHNEKKKPE
jgi:hypothetical protein